MDAFSIAQRLVRRNALPLLAFTLLQLQSHADDEKAAKQLEKLDAQFVKALTELAKSYDEKKIPEAAHFFASCAIGFGGKDEKLALIKGGWEGSVYLGKLRGGDPINETAPITGALGSLSTAYRKILDPWISRARKNDLSEGSRKLMLDAGVKYELARGAHEYVQAIQRFNVLRKAMGTRAILWDFEESRKLILAGWYTCETEDWEYKSPKMGSAFYTNCVEDGKLVARGANKLTELPEALRSFALVRQYLLNPNARTLRLAYWSGGPAIDFWGLYSIPQLPYREDIPTPTQRFKGETLVKDWVDIEETVNVNGQKVPYVRYPYQGETDLPPWFSNGKGYMELGWAKSEYDLLEHGGLPVMVRFFIEATPVDVEASIIDKLGNKKSCQVYLNGDRRVELGSWATILLVPDKQLDGQTEYTVTIRCKLSEASVNKSWTFKTRSK